MPKASKQTKRSRRNTQRPKIQEAMRRAGRPLSSREIAESTGVNYNTVRGALIILRRQGKIRVVGRGLYEYQG